jgi:hypothetical protein
MYFKIRRRLCPFFLGSKSPYFFLVKENSLPNTKKKKKNLSSHSGKVGAFRRFGDTKF